VQRALGDAHAERLRRTADRLVRAVNDVTLSGQEPALEHWDALEDKELYVSYNRLVNEQLNRLRALYRSL
jgi:hypothetical protein